MGSLVLPAIVKHGYEQGNDWTEESRVNISLSVGHLYVFIIFRQKMHIQTM